MEAFGQSLLPGETDREDIRIYNIPYCIVFDGPHTHCSTARLQRFLFAPSVDFAISWIGRQIWRSPSTWKRLSWTPSSSRITTGKTEREREREREKERKRERKRKREREREIAQQRWLGLESCNECFLHRFRNDKSFRDLKLVQKCLRRLKELNIGKVWH